VLRQLKESPELRDIPVIIFTARNRDADLALAFRMGAADYVVKPFSPTELLARIHKTLQQHPRAKGHPPGPG
jgi:DNA-binding response OmpR family regulator